MHRSLFSSLALLGLIAALVLLILFRPGLQDGQTEPPPLTLLDPDTVERIRLEQADQRPLVFTRKAEGWRLRLSGPLDVLDVLANPPRVEALLRLATLPSLQRFACPPQERARFGLDRPRVLLHLDEKATIALGDIHPIDARRYVLLDGTVHLIPETAAIPRSAGPAAFVSRRLLEPSTQIASIQLPGLNLQRIETGWAASPVPPSFSADAANHLVWAWQTASALEVRAYQPAVPISRVHIRLVGHEAPVIFDVLDGGGDLLLARCDLGLTYRLPATQAPTLLELPPSPIP